MQVGQQNGEGPRGGIGCGPAALIFVAAMVLIEGVGGPEKPSAPQSVIAQSEALPELAPSVVQQCRELIAEGQRTGLVRGRPSGHRLDVDERLWRQTDYQTKNALMQAVACDQWRHAMPQGLDQFVVVYGWHSGKRLQMLTEAGMARE